MNVTMFSVFDSKAGVYTQPFFAPTVGVAIRSLQSLMLDHSHTFYTHPEDYTLYRLGEFDDNVGDIAATNPEAIANMVQIKSSFSQET